MRKTLCAWAAVAFLLAACVPSPHSDVPSTVRDSYQEPGAYALIFSVSQLSGWPSGAWDFVYTYGGETVLSGHRIEFPADLFSFSIYTGGCDRKSCFQQCIQRGVPGSHLRWRLRTDRGDSAWDQWPNSAFPDHLPDCAGGEVIDLRSTFCNNCDKNVLFFCFG